MITLNNINLSSINLSGIDLGGIKLGLGGRGSSGDGFPQLPGDVTRWHFGGLTNEMMAAMDDPRIEDADGKGRFLSFKNFLWAGMSGVGGYETYQSVYKFTFDLYANTCISKTRDHVNLTFKVTGLQPGNSLSLAYFGTTNTVYGTWTKDGVYTVNSKVTEVGKPLIFYNGYGSTRGEFTIEIFPLYPGFILGDGVDDFAVTEKELNFEDTYTVYTAFIPFQDDPARNMILCGKDHTKDFYMDYSNLSQISFYSANKPVRTFLSNGFNLFCCKRNAENMTIKNLVTGMSVTATSIDLIDNPGLYFLWKSATHNFYSKAAIAGQIIDNGHFTTDEEDEKVLNWHKKQYPWLFPNQGWTVTGKTNEDEDRATIANITGNGNNLVLSNFGFAENSGYGLYAYNFNSFTLKDNAVKPTDVKNDSFRIVGTGDGSNVSVLSNVSNSANWKIRVTGMKEGDNLIVGNANKSGDYFTITKDGIYTFQKQYEASSTNGVWYNSAQETDVLVEQIPDYEGYLVTDGVDDKIQSSAFTMGKDWTIVGEWKMLSNVSSNCGIVKAQNIYLYNANNGLLISINNPGSLQSFGTKSLQAICSDGRLYGRSWVEYKYTADQNFSIVKSSLNIGFNLSNYNQIAFKNLGIYDSCLLSKEDCIKAYNYLQTLKAK